MIKNFIYLDEQKLYSFSSQLFEGITDFVLNEEFLDKSTEKSSKDGTPITSSQVIANVIRETSKTTEKKFLHDHAFNLFEYELDEKNKILNTSSYDSDEELNAAIFDYSFIKIKARILISDVDEIVYFLQNFNQIGEDLELSQMQESMRIIDSKLLKDKIKDKEKAFEAEFNKGYNIKKQAFDKGLRHPKMWSEALTNLIELNASHALQFHQQYLNTIFSSYVEPDYLRENLTSFKRKYSRLSDKEFTVLGLICHKPANEDKNLEPITLTENSQEGIKTRLRAMAASLLGVEKFSYGQEDNEVVIEPIAIYTEL
ncbi:DUF6414 family protein [Vibrio echinoideorum]|uniref:DUF6414 family protein n=1 Tax=Vibrio echinoideorum TaxID=2100116 RepID=UPI00354E8622